MYKASRRREYERIRLMDEESVREEKDREWSEKAKEWEAKDEEKRKKNAKKRAKARERKGKKGGAGDEEGGGEGSGMRPLAVSVKKDAAAGNDGGEMVDAPVAEEDGIVIHDED